MEIQNKNSTSTALQAISRSELSMAIQDQNFKKASDMLPNTIKNALSCPVMNDLALAGGKVHVLNYIQFELIKLASMHSSGGNLNTPQVEFMADFILGEYGNESIADIKLCFSRGAAGKYGDFYKLDPGVIGVWFKKYLDEKYKVVEDQLMSEKDNPYTPYTPEPANFDWLDAWKKSIEGIETRKVSDLTDEDIKKEGRERPLKKHYPSTPKSMVIENEIHLKWIRANFDPYTGNPKECFLEENEWRKQNGYKTDIMR